jgi:hypothetical protein
MHYLVGANGHSDPVFTQGLITIPQLLRASDTPGLNRLFIFDCCRVDIFSGRGESYACPESRNISLGKSLRTEPGAGIRPAFILNSCSSGQQAYERKDKKHGVFTLALQTVIEDKKVPVTDFSTLVDRIDEAMEGLVPAGTVQTLDQACNPRRWSGVPLFSDWENKPAPATPPPAPAPANAPASPKSADLRYANDTAAAKQNFTVGSPGFGSHATAAKPPTNDPTSPAAQNDLGIRYYNGDSVPQDYAKAVEWYRKAAEQGDADAQAKVETKKTSTKKKLTYAEACAMVRSVADNSIFYVKTFDERKIQNALKSYGHRLTETADTVIMQYDATVFGNAKNGFILTARGIAWKDFLANSDCCFFTSRTNVKCVDSSCFMINNKYIHIGIGFKEKSQQIVKLIRRLIEDCDE